MILRRKLIRRLKPQYLEEIFVLMELILGKRREWIGKTIKIDNVSFKVEKNIPRCVAINLKPQSDDNSFNLLQLLKKNYNHFDMGIYLTALDDGEIDIGNTIDL